MTTRHLTKDKGDLAVAMTLAHLRANNIYACLPISEHLPFDLIAVMPDMTTLRRVQVKYRTTNKDNAYQIQFRSNYYDSQKIYNKHVDLTNFDCYAAYCAEQGQIFYLCTWEIPENGKSIAMRFEPTRSGRKKDVWMAQDYLDPHRMGVCEPVPVQQRQMMEQDEVALNYVLADLMEKGLQPLLAQSQFVPFDLVAALPDMKTLRRVRVGYQRALVNPYVDEYAVYDPLQQQVRYFSADSLSKDQKVIAVVG